MGSSPTVALPVTVRVQGRDWHTWQGRLWRLPESEAKEIPLPLSNRGGGPVAVKAGGPPGHLVPQASGLYNFTHLLRGASQVRAPHERLRRATG